MLTTTHEVVARLSDVTYFRTLANRAIELAMSIGASDVEMSLHIDTGLSVTARDLSTETIEYQQSDQLTLVVYNGQRVGSVSISDLSWPNIQNSVERAYSMSQFTDADDCIGLVDREHLAFGYPELDKYHPWNIQPEQLIDMAISCERSGLDYSEKIVRSDSVNVSTTNALSYYANSRDFSGHYLATDHSIVCHFIAEADGQMQSNYDYTSDCKHDKLLPTAELAQVAARRCIEQLGPQSIPSQRCSVLFEAPAAASLLRHFFSAIRGGNIYRKSSFLVDAIGQKIFPRGFTVKQQPHLLSGLSSIPFDADGVMTKDISFISDGELQAYALGAYSGRKLGMPSTGNACGILNLTMQPGTGDLKQLLQQLGTGFFVTSLIGQGVNITTGEYSRGASGFWVDKGEIQFAVEGVTLAGNLRDMYKNIIAVGDDIDRRGSIHVGSILIKDISLAGT